MSQVPVKSGSGLAPNVAAGLSYVLGFITGIVFYMIEKEDEFVRFHAMQSILFSVGLFVINIAIMIISGIVGFIPVIGVIIVIVLTLASFAVGLGGFVFWIVLIIKAFQGERYHLPYIGEMAEKYAKGS